LPGRVRSKHLGWGSHLRWGSRRLRASGFGGFDPCGRKKPQGWAIPGICGGPEPRSTAGLCSDSWVTPPIPPYLGIHGWSRSKILSALRLFVESSAVRGYGRFSGRSPHFVLHGEMARCSSLTGSEPIKTGRERTARDKTTREALDTSGVVLYQDCATADGNYVQAPAVGRFHLTDMDLYAHLSEERALAGDTCPWGTRSWFAERGMAGAITGV
jgi:hypothetical protein